MIKILQEELFNNRYKIQKELGCNIGRRTFLAQDLQTQKSVVIKLLIFDLNFNWQDLKLFEREIETLKSLSHPAIPTYIDYFSIDTPNLKGFAFVQTYINARPLQEYLTSGRTFSETEIKQLAKSLLLVLHYLHSHQPAVIHRDIKPSNILLINSSAHHVGDVYLVDFGSVQTANPQDGTMTIVGTYGYMAPEQFAGRVTEASDLYSLGATLVYLVTGIEPVDLPSENLQIQFQEAANISSTFTDWLKLMTHPNLNKRFNSAQLALTALESGELTIKKPLFSNISLTKTADYINITIPYKSSLSAKKLDIKFVNNIKKNYKQSWLSKVIEIILLRCLWIRALAILSNFLGITAFMSLSIIVFMIFFLSFIPFFYLIHYFLLMLPEFLAYPLFFISISIINLLLIFLTQEAVKKMINPPEKDEIKEIFKTLLSERYTLLPKDLKHIDTLNLRISKENIIISLTYTTIINTKKTNIILDSSKRKIFMINMKKKSYQLIKTKHNSPHGTTYYSTEQREVPPTLHLWVENKRYGLYYKLSTPEMYWLAEELSYFLDIPINWK